MRAENFEELKNQLEKHSCPMGERLFILNNEDILQVLKAIIDASTLELVEIPLEVIEEIFRQVPHSLEPLDEAGNNIIQEVVYEKLEASGFKIVLAG